MPLVRGKYNIQNPMQSLFGNLVNVNNGVSPAYSNAYWYGAGGWSDAAIDATGVGTWVAIPVDPGATITKVSFVTGATASSTPTHQFGAIYSGIATPALLAQSADGLTTAMAADKLITYTLTSPYTITVANAPNGFIFAGISTTASTINTAVSATSTSTGVWAAAGSNPFGTSAPAFLAATAGTGLAGTAAATIASPSATATAPIIILT